MQEARALLHHALQIYESAFGPNHPDLASNYSNLATVESALGDNRGAVALFDRAIEIQERLVNQAGRWELAHDLAILHANLGIVQRDAGELVGARANLHRGHELQEIGLQSDPSVPFIKNVTGHFKTSH